MTNDLTYEEIKEIVTHNPNITAAEFKKELKGRNIKRVRGDHYTLLGYVVASKGPNITHTHNRTIFLQIVKLLASLKTKVDTATENKCLKTGLSEAIGTKQADVIEILLNSGKFNKLDFITSETPNVKENKPVPPIPTKKTDIGSTPTPSSGNNSHGFINAQFSSPHEKETRYKESKENFHTSLRNDVIGVVITGLLIAAAVMVPSVAGAVVCGIVAALVLIGTGLHIKDSTLPSYREMEENRVEHVSSRCTNVGCNPNA
ncbi:hypothetical protein [Wolbachia endosymbiont of Ctenocephalides felis wCfeJ]|uniref:hypothetical protein n=1 Tax=Wolbachia endosymbiont of Ctenocephalides felis wCfeJ TaxID=2732594 RepID=UPI00144870EC|nr:hypothetical protein [Wolbachia endosymbiont of Ctenocephalides felis wCfeJ]WCR58382.1 MAG: hypothetical protein PG980_000854 [Wolbachia endosymbiont of Ctenocephalides felis wCfeJ]